jgi:hypothetical protein
MAAPVGAQPRWDAACTMLPPKEGGTCSGARPSVGAAAPPPAPSARAPAASAPAPAAAAPAAAPASGAGATGTPPVGSTSGSHSAEQALCRHALPRSPAVVGPG